MAEKDMERRLDAIKQLLALFRWERTVYLIVTMLSLAVLLTIAVMLVLDRKAGAPELVGLFGSSGAITYTTGRLLRMWSEALGLVAAATRGKE